MAANDAVTLPTGPVWPVVPFPLAGVGGLLPSTGLLADSSLYPESLMNAGLYAELQRADDQAEANAGAAEAFPVARSPEVYA